MAENPTKQPIDLYVYIPTSFQFDKKLCKVLPK